MNRMRLIKISLISLFLSFSINISVRSQVYDKTEDDIRVIISDDEKMYKKISGYAMFNLSLSLSETNEDLRLWRLNLSLYEGDMTIAKGRLLLIKFKDGSVMELKNKSEIGPLDYKTRYIGGGITYHYVCPSYDVSRKNLEKLLKEKVVKVRIENDFSYIDRKIMSKDFQININRLYDQVEESLSKSNDVREDF